MTSFIPSVERTFTNLRLFNYIVACPTAGLSLPLPDTQLISVLVLCITYSSPNIGNGLKPASNFVYHATHLFLNFRTLFVSHIETTKAHFHAEFSSDIGTNNSYIFHCPSYVGLRDNSYISDQFFEMHNVHNILKQDKFVLNRGSNR
jgi:hypothetical protein